MTVELKKLITESTYLDPRKNFEPQSVNIEVRWDPLTGRISRIFPFRNLILHRHDWNPFVEESRQKFCPFCPNVMEKVTPKFTPDIAPEGRITVGEAVAIPNLNPYEKYAAVIIMSPRHYIAMDEIDEQLIIDSFKASLVYLQRAYSADPKGAAFASINWNYMPYAGGSLIHPHLQVLAGAEPSTFTQQLIASSSQYHNQNQRNYWEDLIAEEQKHGERFIGHTGGAQWISAFAPRHVGEVTGILQGKQTISDINDHDLLDLAQGMKKVIDYYNRCNIVSFNSALYFARQEDKGFTVHLRIVGRFTIFPLVGSDITHMQVLHDDPWTVVSPEAIATELKQSFALA